MPNTFYLFQFSNSFQESTVITSILIMKIWGLDLGEVAQLLSDIAETLSQMTVLPNHDTILHSFWKVYLGV